MEGNWDSEEEEEMMVAAAEVMDVEEPVEYLVTCGPLACNSSLCAFLCLATIFLVISVVLYISSVTDFMGETGSRGCCH